MPNSNDRSARIRKAEDDFLVKLRSTCEQFNRDIAHRVFNPRIEDAFEPLRDIENSILQFDRDQAQQQLEQVRTTGQATGSSPFCRDNAALLIRAISRIARRIPELLKRLSPQLKPGDLVGETTLLLDTTKNRITNAYRRLDEGHAGAIRTALTPATRSEAENEAAVHHKRGSAKQTVKSKAPTANERMKEILLETPDACEWSIRKWSRETGFAVSTLADTPLWNSLKISKAGAKAERLRKAASMTVRDSRCANRRSK